jgi:hypothetical protein
MDPQEIAHGAVNGCWALEEISRRIKATFRTDDLIIAEYFFDLDGSPPVGTSGDLVERAKAAFDKFTRNKASFPLVNGGVWVRFDTRTKSIARNPKANAERGSSRVRVNWAHTPLMRASPVEAQHWGYRPKAAQFTLWPF